MTEQAIAARLTAIAEQAVQTVLACAQYGAGYEHAKAALVGEMEAALLAHVETLTQQVAELERSRDAWAADALTRTRNTEHYQARAEQAEQQRDAAHAALRELREAVLSRACVESQHCGIDTDPAMALADAALAASAPQKEGDGR